MTATTAVVVVIVALLAATVLNTAINAIRDSRVAKHSDIDPRSDREVAKAANRGNRDLGRS